MGRYSRPEVEYVADEGFVRLNLRRPVNLYVPTELQESYDPTAESEDPKAKLELEWVYGYRGRDCRSNIFILASGELVYFAASVVVIYNPETKTQRHFVHHTDDIKCIAVHPDGKTIATGQIKGRDDNLPHVCVWNSETLEPLIMFGQDTFNRGVACVAFSKDGDTLAAVDDAPEPRLTAWQWSTGTLLAKQKAAADPILGVNFSNESPSRIITSGKYHLVFWTLGDEGTLTKKAAIFGSHEKPKYVTTVASFPSGDIVTGDSNGNIFVWKQGGNTVSFNKEAAHEGTVFSLNIDEESNVISAGKDRKIVSYNSDLDPIDEGIEIPEEFGSPRVVMKLGDDYIVGTTNNAIIKASSENDPEVITQGHLEELWGLACHRSEPHFVTAGQDGKVYYRDAASHDIVWSKVLEGGCQSADISPSANVVVVGGQTGKWIVIDSESQETVFEATDGDEPIQVTRFSPDGGLLALGSRDNKIYVYTVEDDGKSYSQKGICEGHSSFITHLDWSADGQMIRSNSGDYEVLFWRTEDCSMEPQSEETKDLEFATNNCILAFNSIGIWPPGTDGTHINSCNKAVDKPLIASGDDHGTVKLFAFPSTTQNANCIPYHGHSSHVTNVIFFAGDSLLVSSGGRDTTTLQWKVVDSE